MRESKSPKVLWLTNLPAPYRFPIWDRMSETLNLHVVFTLKRQNWRNWPEPTLKKWRHSYLSLNSIQIKEHDFIPSFRGSSKILRDVDVVIVGGWENFIFIRTILLAKRRGIPVIQFYESNEESKRFSKGVIARIRKWIFQKPNLFITISKQSSAFIEKLGVDSERIVTIFNPVDVGWYYDYAKTNRKLQDGGHRFLYVGQLIERKNIDTVIRAFSKIRNYQDTLTIAGDGHLDSKLRQLVGSLGLNDSVNFVGHKNQENLAEIYATSNTLILASKNEVWGLVVNEALASGIHVVVSDKCGVASFAEKMRGVYLCSPDQISIQKAMLMSSKEWKGFIDNPEIVQYSPEKFVEKMMSKILVN